MPHSSTFTVSIQPERSALLAGHGQTIHAGCAFRRPPRRQPTSSASR